MLGRIVLVVALMGSCVVALTAEAHAVGGAGPGAVGGPTKKNAGIVIGKPIYKNH